MAGSFIARAKTSYSSRWAHLSFINHHRHFGGKFPPTLSPRVWSLPTSFGTLYQPNFFWLRNTPAMAEPGGAACRKPSASPHAGAHAMPARRLAALAAHIYPVAPL